MNRSTQGARLLASAADLSYPDRQRLLVSTAQEAQRSGHGDALLAQMTNEGWWGERIALDLAVILPASSHVLAARSSSDPVVAARAWRLAVRHGMVSAPEMAERIVDLPQAWRIGIAAEIRRASLSEMAEALFPVIRERFGDAEALGLLSSCGPDTVALVLPQVDHRIQRWASLARRHPRVFLGHVRRELESSSPAGTKKLWEQYLSGLTAAVTSDPGAVLDLIERGDGDLVLPGSNRELAVLARFAPHRVLAVLLNPRYPTDIPVSRPFFEALLVLSNRELVELVRLLQAPGVLRLLKVLPPGRRDAIFTSFLDGATLGEVGLPVKALDLLPTLARVTHAERLLQYRGGDDDPAARLQLTARLEWSYCRDKLLEKSSQPSAMERSVGYQLLITAAVNSRRPEIIGEMLSLLSRLRNDQDQVRLAAINSLLKLPIWLLAADGVPLLLQVAIDALQARDCSGNTRQAVHQVTMKLVVEGVLSRRPDLRGAAMELWARQVEQFPAISFPDLHRQLPSGGGQLMLQALLPRIEAEKAVGKFNLALQLAADLGRRAFELPVLEAVVALACSAVEDAVVRRAIPLWLANSQTRDSRVELLVRADPTVIALPSVQQVVGLRRTDLLTTVLNHRDGGRFQSAGVVLVPTFSGCFRRWAPQQLTRYSDLLLGIAVNRQKSVWERALVIRTLAYLPGMRSGVNAFVDDAQVGVAEAALTALDRLEDPAAVLPELVARSAGPQSRVAMVAVSRGVRQLPPGEIAPLLLPLVTCAKITSRKEALRLLVQHRVPQVGELLARTWASPNQHRDVRRTIVSLCLDLLDGGGAENSWQIMDAAVVDSSVGAALLNAHPRRIAPAHRARLATLISTLTDSVDPAVRRSALEALGVWGEFDEGPGRERLIGVVTDLIRVADWQIAGSAVIAIAGITGDMSALVQICRTLLQGSDSQDHAVDRDLPARQRLRTIAEVIINRAEQHRELRSGASMLAEEYQADPTFRRLVVDLLAAAIDWTATSEVVEDRLARLRDFASETMLIELAVIAIRGPLSTRLYRPAPAQWVQIADRLTGRPDGASGRLAVELVGAAGSHSQWPQSWQEQLLKLRNHPDLETRTAALDTFIHFE